MTVEVTLSKHRRPAPQLVPPPLNPGDHLSRAEFERRYEAQPYIKVAELIEGVVYMPSPARSRQHSQPHGWIVGWLTTYMAATPGIYLDNNGTLLLEEDIELQPDASLRLDPTLGGQCRVNEDDYLEGPPELVVEIAASSAAYDLHKKKDVYARNGVREYIAMQIYEQDTIWFALRNGVYQALQPDDSGVLRSEIFPGLWLQPAAFWAGDVAALLATLQAGLASPEHAAFVAQIREHSS